MANILYKIILSLNGFVLLEEGDIVEYNEDNLWHYATYKVRNVMDDHFYTNDLEKKEKSKIVAIFRYKNNKLRQVWNKRKNKKIY